MGIVMKGAVQGGAGRVLLAAVLLVGCLAGCVSLKPAPADGERERAVWKARDQFVTLVSQEEGAVANSHPAHLSPGDLRRMLASVGVVMPGGDAPVPLFSETELKVLEDAGARALGGANPHEDVTFAVFGYHAALEGFLKQARVTTGRMFCQDGKLNLILGIAQGEVMENEDRRLSPFTPGSRLQPSDTSARFTEGRGGMPFTMKRRDWLVFSLPAAVPAARESARPSIEPAPPVAMPPVSPQKGEAKVDHPAGEPRSLEERLILLNQLKQKGLITEEEYRAKRLQILDEL